MLNSTTLTHYYQYILVVLTLNILLTFENTKESSFLELENAIK